jgi:3-hydroxyisobutyrate dehydrogenase-like beta-hydroxyacid dehydrogenase
MSGYRRIAVIGFGEAGGILGSDLARSGREVTTYDLLLEAPASRGAILAKAAAAGVRACASAREAIAGAQLVICAVTAASAAEAAGSAAAALQPGQVFLDINSVSPAVKHANARTVEPSGADYLDAAVMAPVPSQRLAVPMLLGGPRAAGAAEALRSLGMQARVISDRVGVASAVKMCRSIVIKGLEALVVESLFAARRFGAEEEVLASLEQTFPHMGWEGALPDYLVSRVAEHGQRRAAEMREVARTLGDVKLEPLMALAAARRQEELVEAMAALRIEYPHDRTFSWRTLADALGAGPVPARSVSDGSVSEGKASSLAGAAQRT